MTAQTFAQLAKDLTASSVHTPTALGNDKRKGKRAKTFRAFVGEPINKRDLHPHDDATAKTPFLYDVNALSSLRPDQVPRFLGALTDSAKLPDATVKLSDLHAMQDRVDPEKVAFFQNNPPAKSPVVVRHNDKNYIADGHHRLAAQWLNGDDEAQVKFKDLTDVDNAMKAKADKTRDQFRVAKVDESLGLVFGWAIVCKVQGRDYFDWNVDHAGTHKGKLVPEHITEDAMTKAATGFALGDRAGNEQHAGPDVGTYPFIFPLTTEIAKAMGIQSDMTGLMVAYKPPKDVLAKFASGEYSGFSVEGLRVHTEEHA